MSNFKNIFINLVTIFVFFTLMILGTWQIDRLGQKNDLLKKNTKSERRHNGS